MSYLDLLCKSCDHNIWGTLADSDTSDDNNSVQLLRLGRSHAPPEWLAKLPHMAERLEETLYRAAPSFEAYNDVTTLKTRLTVLAMNIEQQLGRL